jgi:hypothetical protein
MLRAGGALLRFGGLNWSRKDNSGKRTREAQKDSNDRRGNEVVLHINRLRLKQQWQTHHKHEVAPTK